MPLNSVCRACLVWIVLSWTWCLWLFRIGFFLFKSQLAWGEIRCGFYYWDDAIIKTLFLNRLSILYCRIDGVKSVIFLDLIVTRSSTINFCSTLDRGTTTGLNLKRHFSKDIRSKTYFVVAVATAGLLKYMPGPRLLNFGPAVSVLDNLKSRSALLYIAIIQIFLF